MKRDEWMTDSFFSKHGGDRSKAPHAAPGSHQRELNPFWKSGDGAPATGPRPADTGTPNSWTRMKVKRALEAIEKGEITYEQAAVDRFGSVEELDSLCRLYGLKVGRPSRSPLPVPRPGRPLDETSPTAAANRQMVQFLKHKHAKQTFECMFCEVDAKSIKSEADYTFLVVPERPVNPLHFMIVPKCHEESTIECGAAVLNEIRNYKKSLIRLFADNHCLPVFVELRRRAGDRRQHVHIHCFGVPEAQVDLSMLFRKSVSEAESYWATHRAIIECPDGLARALPRRPFPFIHVDLWTESFVHIIEDDRWFPPEWPSETVRRVVGNNFTVRRPEFTPHDWTREVEANGSE